MSHSSVDSQLDDNDMMAMLMRQMNKQLYTRQQSNNQDDDADDLQSSHASEEIEEQGANPAGDFDWRFQRRRPSIEEEPAPTHQPVPAKQQAVADDTGDADTLPTLGGADNSFFNFIEKDAGKNPHRHSVDGDADVDGQAPAPKRSFGNKVKGFFKGARRMAQGVWGLGKNLTGYNLLRHGLIGANFRRGKLNKNLAKWNALGETDAERFNAPGVWEIQRKIMRNKMMLANHRHYYTGLKMANEFRRGAGKDIIRNRPEAPLPGFFLGE